MDDFIRFAVELDIFFVFLAWLAFFILHIYILRKRIYNILDPLLFFCFFNSFSLCLVLNLSVSEDNYRYILDLVVWTGAFFCGFLLYKSKISWNIVLITTEKLNKEIAHVYFFLVFNILFVSTVALWVIRGVPLFAENPSDAKVALYAGGFGLVRYIHFLTPPVLVFYSFYHLLKKQGSSSFRLMLWGYLAFSIVVSLSAGSKSSLIFLVIIFGYIAKLYEKSSIPVFDAKLPIKIACIFSIFAMFLVLALSGGDVLKSLAIRLVASGDVYFFWYSNSAYDVMQNFDLSGFVSYVFNPLLAMLGIVAPDFPLGAIIMNESTGFPLSSFGPNAQLPIVMGFYLYYIKYLLALFFGFFMAIVRVSSYKLLSKYGVFGLSLMVLLFFNATSIFVDMNLFLSLLYSAFLIFMPIYLLSRLIVFSVKKND
jgi:hypothetical protein